MGDHRGRRRASRHDSGARANRQHISPSGPSGLGRRRAGRPRSRLRAAVPGLLGVAALAISAVGAATITEAVRPAPSASSAYATHSPQTGSNAVSTITRASREQQVSRDSSRQALAQAADQKVEAAVERQAKQRSASLAQIAAAAEKQARKIELNRWVLPTAGYRLTARFGQVSGLWSSIHTGLDFASGTGTPIHAVASGTVVSASYDGAYGNKTVVRLADGTEIWYCHQNAFGVSVGQSVSQGQVIGYVGSTGNVTGPHLHLEVRPGGGDPVDPYAALVAHGVTP